MTNLTIKNIPSGLYDQLKQSAAQHRRSINSEAIICLERALHNIRIDTQAFMTKAHALRKKTSGYVLTDKVIFNAKNERRP
jgi:plasmid stability protein